MSQRRRRANPWVIAVMAAMTAGVVVFALSGRPANQTTSKEAPPVCAAESPDPAEIEREEAERAELGPIRCRLSHSFVSRFVEHRELDLELVNDSTEPVSL